MKRQLDILKAVAFATYKEWAAYRSHSMVSLFVGPAYLLVQVSIWTAIYSAGGSINGLSLTDMITYYGVATLIGYITMDFADWNLQMLIRTGKYTTFVLRPVSHVFFALSQKIGHRVLGFIFEFVPVYLILFIFFDINLIPAYIGWAILSIFLGYLMMFFVDYCIGITGFWIVETGGVRNVFRTLSSFCSGSVIPLMLFPDAVQKVFFVLPFQYMTYVPIRVFIGSYELGGISMPIPQIVMIQLALTAIMAAITALLSKLGERRFTGVGI